MGIFSCVLVLYLLSFVLQIALFRIRIPKNQILAILIIYPIVLLIFLATRLLGLFDPNSIFSLSVVECIYLSAVFMAILPNYAVLYGLIEAESPSSLMALMLEASGEKGLARDSFSDLLTNDLFLWHRVAALEKGGYVKIQNERYFITPKGLLYMHLWLAPRYLMGRKTYGG